MVLGLADNRDPRSLASRLRRQRMAWFADLLTAVPAPVRVLDVGGTVAFWRSTAADWLPRCQVTLLNLRPEAAEELPGVTSVAGDARHMPQFADSSFDLCFSNSVIEHVGTLFDQQAMAQEIRRVSRGYFVQTPYRHFPIEPHFLVPFWQYLPPGVRTALFRRFRLGWMGRQPDPFLARAEVEQVRLLNRREMQCLFPEATLLAERVGPLVKSLVARKAPGSVDTNSKPG